MPSTEDAATLEQRRDRLRLELGAIGDLRPSAGSCSATARPGSGT